MGQAAPPPQQSSNELIADALYHALFAPPVAEADPCADPDPDPDLDHWAQRLPAPGQRTLRLARDALEHRRAARAGASAAVDARWFRRLVLTALLAPRKVAPASPTSPSIRPRRHRTPSVAEGEERGPPAPSLTTVETVRRPRSATEGGRAMPGSGNGPPLSFSAFLGALESRSSRESGTNNSSFDSDGDGGGGSGSGEGSTDGSVSDVTHRSGGQRGRCQPAPDFLITSYASTSSSSSSSSNNNNSSGSSGSSGSGNTSGYTSAVSSWSELPPARRARSVTLDERGWNPAKTPQPFRPPFRATVGAAEALPYVQPPAPPPRPGPRPGPSLEYERFVPPAAAAVLGRYASPAFAHALAAELCGEDERFASPRAAVLAALFQRAQPGPGADRSGMPTSGDAPGLGFDVRLGVVQALLACAAARAERCRLEANLFPTPPAPPSGVEPDHDSALVEALGAVSSCLLRDALHAATSWNATDEGRDAGAPWAFTVLAASLLQRAAMHVLRCQGSALGRRVDGEAGGAGLGLEQPAAVAGALAALRALHLAHAVAHLHRGARGPQGQGREQGQGADTALVAEGLAQVLCAWRAPLTGPSGAAACVPLQALLHALRLLLHQLDAADVAAALASRAGGASPTSTTPLLRLPPPAAPRARLGVLIGRVVSRLLCPARGARALHGKAACACLDLLADAHVLRALFDAPAEPSPAGEGGGEEAEGCGAWRRRLVEALACNHGQHWHPAVRAASAALLDRIGLQP